MFTEDGERPSAPVRVTRSLCLPGAGLRGRGWDPGREQVKQPPIQSHHVQESLGNNSSQEGG